jgi:branched-chain amino acid aminotransferase
MILKIFLNGEIVDQENAVVSVFDHGFLYGDGVFEGIRAYNGRVFRLAEHVKRLYESAKAIELEIPMGQQAMQDAITSLLKENQLQDAYIRPVVSRGEGPMGIDPDNCSRATVVIIATHIKVHSEEDYRRGLKIVTASTRRIVADSLSPRIKSCNYINNILAKMEAKRAGASEAIMLDRNGYVGECTADNVFIVQGEKVITPPPYVGLLKGVTRDAAMEAATSLGYEVKEEVFTVFDMYTADECFLTGTAVEIAPVVWIDGKTVGEGRPGKVTQQIRKRYMEMTREE